MKKETNYNNTIMDKKELRKELNDIKAKIKANSTDAHFAETLVAELLSVKGQLDHEPTLVHLPLSDIDKSLNGDTFNIYAMKNGDAVYRLKGGLTLVATNGFESLNATLRDFVLNQDEVETTLSDEDKKLYETDLFATTMILNLPIIAFSDLEFKYKIYSKILDYMVELQDKFITNAEVQDETPEENKRFEDASIALDVMKDELEKEVIE